MSGPNNSQSEAELTLGLLRAVDEDDALTQRSAARELGVALGLVNAYLKRCVKKGLIKVKQVPPSRYAYYLTAKGFAEKSRLSAEFLTQSLSLFRQAQSEYKEIMELCSVRGWRRIALYGVGDLAEIFLLFARDYPVEVVGIVDPDATEKRFCGVRVFATGKELGEIDAYVLTAINKPQPVYESMLEQAPLEQTLAPKLLEVSPPRMEKGE